MSNTRHFIGRIPGGAGRTSKTGDDLKRIRGIAGPLEYKLHHFGITTYEQIANWTPKDIALVSDHLNFKGRIERENWIKQAKILSGGGETEFSQRFDRGDLEPGDSSQI